MNADGTQLEVYAWGLRNPFGVMWSPDGKLYAADLGFDERGSRPIGNAPDAIWEVKQGAWYGWPDYAAGIPVTDPRFKPSRGEAPKFLMKTHPDIEKPVLTLPPHSSPTKMDFSRGSGFGVAGHMYIGLSVAGSRSPVPASRSMGQWCCEWILRAARQSPFSGLPTRRADQKDTRRSRHRGRT
jgi:glucose/arabinose dehydrogenase